MIICICNSTEYIIDTGSDRIKNFILGGEGGRFRLRLKIFNINYHE